MNYNNQVLQYLKKKNILDIKDFIRILDHSFDGVVLSDGKGFMFYVNKALARMTGIDQMDFIGRKPTEYKQEGLIIKAAKKITDNISNVVQLSKHKITGEEKVYLITTVPVKFKGKLIYLSNFREINKLGNLQMELLAETSKANEFEFTEELKSLLNVFSSKHLVLKSNIMINLMKTVSRVARTSITVNITGESGVGKDVIANMIHNLSDRKEKPFIQINCGSIPEHLLESELFGYTGGSFTGASKYGRMGLLQSANGGTVFLDEIGDLPLNLQAKVLKALHDLVIYPVGGRKPIELDIRFVCATNKDITQMVKEGTFREDLYFRINMVPINVPPLRDRSEDIVHLCKFFLQKNNEKYGMKKVLSPSVYNKLEHYSWPGNVRELKHLIERLVVVTEHERIDVSDLPTPIANKSSAYKIHKPGHNLRHIMKEIEKDIINEVIGQHGCRKAAEILEIDYSTLKRKKKQFNFYNQI